MGIMGQTYDVSPNVMFWEKRHHPYSISVRTVKLESNHEENQINPNWGTLCKILAWMPQKCQCHKRQKEKKLGEWFWIKEAKEIWQLNITSDPWLGYEFLKSQRTLLRRLGWTSYGPPIRK